MSSRDGRAPMPGPVSRPPRGDVARITIGPGEIEYCDTAAGFASASMSLVFLHEGLGSVELWRDFPARVRGSVGSPRSLVYSRHGYGHSDPLPTPWPLTRLNDEAVDVLPRVLDALDVPAPVLIGHSDGASIALAYAAAGFPASAIVLLAPHVFVEECTLAGVRAAVSAFRHGDLRARLARYHGDPDGAFGGWSSMWLDPGFRDWNIGPSLSGVRVPVLVIQGEEDQYGTRAQVDAIARHCTGPVTVRLWPGIGHAPHQGEDDRTVELIAEFLRAEKILAVTNE